jgi:hypothetical protein
LYGDLTIGNILYSIRLSTEQLKNVRVPLSELVSKIIPSRRNHGHTIKDLFPEEPEWLRNMG